jgi:uncharacterized membrane protein
MVRVTMSGQTYLWIKAVHFLGFFLWLGSMSALAVVLRAHAGAAEAARSAFEGLERTIARTMEWGALLSITCGVIMIAKSPGPVSPMKQPYLHIKLTLVVVILALHGLVRMKMGKLRKDPATGVPAIIPWLIVALAAAIFALAVVKPMYRN